ncbi:Very-long-chain (3R)-3-hydroxyacyl-CoA dehydratase [Oryzias melastigma]|uniref:Very-long-chain (3R)-3-hydroxyacyl-CoA dehydratase n=1 Tax=Oryzias melastigma TaxID=30732 RepID=A0A834CQC6_ORYME|nr:Very-long-chain (3R)-3-hydroxyacyl-CoA dehydratase [Oryzias melastigma]
MNKPTSPSETSMSSQSDTICWSAGKDLHGVSCRCFGGHLLLGWLCDEPCASSCQCWSFSTSPTASRKPDFFLASFRCVRNPIRCLSDCVLLSFTWTLYALIQVMEKNILLIVVTMCEDIQREPVVCVQFFLWNILDLLRYPHELLCVVATPSITMLQTRYSLWIPLYTLSVINEGAVINRALTFTEPAALTCPHFQISLSSMIYLPVLAIAFLLNAHGSTHTDVSSPHSNYWLTGTMKG